MLNKIGYIFLYGWAKLHAFLPMSVLYLFSDIFYFLAYKVVRYRVKVVRRNLKNSFPEKTEKERQKIEKEFYHHFSDYVIETIKLANISKEELIRRAYIRNPELVDKMTNEGHTCFVLLLGHYGNWEWFAGPSTFKDSLIHVIYRPLSNKVFDKFFLYLRTRFGSIGIKKNDTFRDIIRLKKEGTHAVVVFIADQTPSKANIHYWTPFLNQETPMFSGPERIARKLDIPVIFADMKKVKRGYYTVDFELITDKPKETPEYWITEQYARRMENCIMRNPAYWLWTHKRWKYKRSDIEK